jgi:Branched-chain amino acid ABC-type transport system, permease components
MQYLLETTVNGVTLGAIYALIALGFVVVFKATSILNFAHGSFLVLGSYLAVTLLSTLGLPFLLAIVLIPLVMGGLGIAIHYSVMRWMVGKAFFAVVLTTVGMEIIIHAALLMGYGPSDRGRLTGLPDGRIRLGPLEITIVNAIIIGTAALTVLGFLWFFKRTRTGLHMRAMADNLEAAAAQGISPNWMYALAWCTGLGMAGIGGVLYAHYTPSIHLDLTAVGLRAFPAAVLGGLDSVGGAVVGGLVLGLIETIGSAYFGAEYRDVLAFGTMFVMLLLRPTGFFGSKELVRV